jgi:hypothetical protein
MKTTGGNAKRQSGIVLKLVAVKCAETQVIDEIDPKGKIN